LLQVERKKWKRQRRIYRKISGSCCKLKSKKGKQVSKFVVEKNLLPNPPPLTYLEIFLRSMSIACLPVFTALLVLEIINLLQTASRICFAVVVPGHALDIHTFKAY